MKKKIIQHGPSSLIVALPSSFVRKFNLKGSQEIEVEERGKQLIMSLPSSVISRKQLEIDTPSARFIRLILSIPYKQGYDEVKVTFKDKKVLDVVQKELSLLIGYEIVETGNNYCLIKSVAQESEKEFDSILRRTFLLLIQMSKESYDALKDNRQEKLSSIALYEKTNNTYTNFCKRILNKKSYPVPEKAFFLYAIVKLLEELADEYRDICIDLSSSPKAKISSSLLELYTKVNLQLERAYHLFYGFNLTSAAELTSSWELLLKDNSVNYFQKGNPVIIHHLLNISLKSYSLLGPIYGLNI